MATAEQTHPLAKSTRRIKEAFRAHPRTILTRDRQTGKTHALLEFIAETCEEACPEGAFLVTFSAMEAARIQHWAQEAYPNLALRVLSPLTYPNCARDRTLPVFADEFFMLTRKLQKELSKDHRFMGGIGSIPDGLITAESWTRA